MEEGAQALVVNVLHASGLPAHDRNGFSDPYVCLVVESGEHQSVPKKRSFHHNTRTIHKSLDPVWEEVFSLAAKDLDQALRLYVFDHNIIARDVFLCWGEIKMQQIQDAGGYIHEHEFKMINEDGHEAGSVFASVTYGTPQCEVPPPVVYDPQAEKREKSKAKAAERLEKNKPTAPVSEETLAAATKLNLTGKQVDRAYKYYSMADVEGTGKISYADFAKLEDKIRKKGPIHQPLMFGAMKEMRDNQQHMLFDMGDLNADGFLTFDEFLGLWKDIEVQLLGSSWNPIKNQRDKFAVASRRFKAGQEGNYAGYVPPGYNIPGQQRQGGGD